MAEGIPKLHDEKVGDHFYFMKSDLEKKALPEGKKPETLDDKLGVYAHFHDADTGFQQDIYNRTNTVVHGGPGHDKGALKYAENKLYDTLKNPEDKLHEDKDIRSVLSTFMDEFLTHTCYERFKELTDDIKKGKHGGEKYHEEEIFQLKKKIFDEYIGAGRAYNPNTRQKIHGIDDLIDSIKGQERRHVQGKLRAFGDEVVQGYLSNTVYKLGDEYFTHADRKELKDKVLGGLKGHGYEPPGTIAHKGHQELLGDYRNIVQKNFQDYKKIEQKQD